MAAYNEEQYITEAIESILKQTFEDFEFIIVDDGSTDETSTIIESYAAGDERIRMLTNDPNQGLPASLNRGINEARGEYIARMDADDRSRLKRLATQVQFLDANLHIHVVGSHVQYIGKRGEKLGIRICTTDKKSAKTRKRDRPDVAHPSVMMRRSSVQTVGNYREPFAKAQDLDLWVRMAREFGPSFTGVIPNVLFEYRLTPNFVSRRETSPIYGSHAGELVGREDELRDRIASHLKREDTDFTPTERDSAYHILIGRRELNQGDKFEAFKHSTIALQKDPIYFFKESAKLLWSRRIRKLTKNHNIRHFCGS